MAGNEAGIDPHGGDNADATSDGGLSVPRGGGVRLRSSGSFVVDAKARAD